MNKYFRSKSGLGLLEVIVASAIFGVVALGVSSLIVSTQQATQSVQRRSDSIELQQFISQILVNRSLCNASLAGKPAPANGASVPTLSFSGVAFDETANNLPFGGSIKIESLKYKNVVIAGPVATALLELVVDLRGRNGGSVVTGGYKQRAVNFPFVATLAGATIATCGTPLAMSGITGTLPSDTSQCNTTYPGPPWRLTPGGNIGASRNCFAYVERFSKTYRYNSAGCHYDAALGKIFACSGDNSVQCAWVCFN